ncbi:hypothetical protein HK099_008380 [Clydaea vesicula]|uniref:DUF125-domain-containing protein n=1 Tax=Clydaea vesicula TaxID=447962 RepID=A0AAD5TYU9_9FUNG|nr:hypothetical protein HK099_008380 [Clydaea vesicula]KAJ3383616.1 hypothetical protein HDU92_004038 [Lobulomyces angularis]
MSERDRLLPTSIVNSNSISHTLNEDTESVHSTSSYGHEHFSSRNPWLRAAVLGANDGLVSTGALLLGVVAASQDNVENSVLLTGISGLVAGSFSMGLGEYLSVSSQRDTELADIEKEILEHAKGPYHRKKELEELTQIYVDRGLSYELAHQVAVEFTKIDPIQAHVREELGIDMNDLTNPLQAAVASVFTFAFGALGPLLMVVIFQDRLARLISVSVMSLVLLTFFGGFGAYLGGASIPKGCFRVGFGGSLALAATFGVGLAFGTTVA